MECDQRNSLKDISAYTHFRINIVKRRRKFLTDHHVRTLMWSDPHADSEPRRVTQSETPLLHKGVTIMRGALHREQRDTVCGNNPSAGLVTIMPTLNYIESYLILNEHGLTRSSYCDKAPATLTAIRSDVVSH